MMPHGSTRTRTRACACRQAEINKKKELSALADIKRLEIMAAERLQHQCVPWGLKLSTASRAGRLSVSLVASSAEPSQQKCQDVNPLTQHHLTC
jgi:hypothetical protein